MLSLWIESLHNLHCPSCDRRLIERATLHLPDGQRDPVVVGEVGTLQCPTGDPLPDRAFLYALRAVTGRPAVAAVREVPPPVAAPAPEPMASRS